MVKEWQCPRCNTVNVKPDHVLRLAQLRQSIGLQSVGASGGPAPRCSGCGYEADLNALLEGKYDTREESVSAPLPQPKKEPAATVPGKPARKDRLATIIVGSVIAAIVCGVCILIIGVGIYWNRNKGRELPPASPTSTAKSLPPTNRATEVVQTPESGRRTGSLDICLFGEPASLLIYNDNSQIAGYVRQAVMDGPIDQVGYTLQPVILKMLPSLENGDVQIKPVTVREGDTVSDAYDTVKSLERGDQLTGPDGSVFTYQGGAVQTSQFEVTFRLREDISWSDGTPLTANDSYFSYTVASDPGIGDYLSEATQDYGVVDNQTVVWTSIPGYWSTQPYDGFFPPLPEHAYGSMLPTELLEDEAANFNPLGWGAYVVDEWARGDHITFKPNPHYFRADEGLPWIESLTFHFYTDPDQILDDLLAGKCDAALSDSYTFETPILQRFDELRRAETADKLAIRYAPNGLEHLVFNVAPGEAYYRPPLLTDSFQSADLRQAVAYCIDRPALIENHYAGLGLPPDSYLPFDHPYHAKDLPDYAFDPAKGQQMLESLGWVDADGNGIREMGDEELSISYHTTNAPLRQDVGGEIARMLRENCGMEVNLTVETSTELLGQDGTLSKGRYDLAQFAWMYMYYGDVARCDLFSDESNNYMRYHSLDYSRVCHEALTQQDAVKRAEFVYETQRILMDELPILPLFTRLWFGIARADLQNFTVQPGTFQLQEIESFFIEP